MNFSSYFKRADPLFLLAIGFLILTSTVILNSIAKFIFPTYFLYLFLGILFFFIFSLFDFEVLSLFSKFLYISSIVLLLLPLLIGQVTRGAVRWIPLGPLTIQPAEIVRPFLLIFFATFLTSATVTFKRLIKALFLLALPVALILIQPSLGVSVLTTVGFLGILLASAFSKRYILLGAIFFLLAVPVFFYLLAPYQKQRLLTFIEPSKDPRGAGYNSIQSMISVGSGKFLGRGLGEGVQTQLAFLPERQTDFVFASIAEELGFVGAILILSALFLLVLRLLYILENAGGVSERAYLSGFVLIVLAQILIHIGMNMGLLPITGIPLPLVSAGGSSFLGTMIGLGIAIGTQKI